MAVTLRFRDRQALADTSFAGPRPLSLASSVLGLHAPPFPPQDLSQRPALHSFYLLMTPRCASPARCLFLNSRLTDPPAHLISLLPYSRGLSN